MTGCGEEACSEETPEDVAGTDRPKETRKVSSVHATPRHVVTSWQVDDHPPPEVRTRIVETASLLNMSVLHIIQSLLIAQPWPKDQAALQVPKAALPDAAPSAAAPTPGTSLPTTGAAPSAPSPAALGVQVSWRSRHEADAS